MVEQEDDLYATLYICRLPIMILPVHKNGVTGRRPLCNLVYIYRLPIMILPVHKNGGTGRRHLCNLVYMQT